MSLYLRPLYISVIILRLQLQHIHTTSRPAVLFYTYRLYDFMSIYGEYERDVLIGLVGPARAGEYKIVRINWRKMESNAVYRRTI